VLSFSTPSQYHPHTNVCHVACLRVFSILGVFLFLDRSGKFGNVVGSGCVCLMRGADCCWGWRYKNSEEEDFSREIYTGALSRSLFTAVAEIHHQLVTCRQLMSVTSTTSGDSENLKVIGRS
jgi:hypothetical protein